MSFDGFVIKYCILKTRDNYGKICVERQRPRDTYLFPKSAPSSSPSIDSLRKIAIGTTLHSLCIMILKTFFQLRSLDIRSSALYGRSKGSTISKMVEFSSFPPSTMIFRSKSTSLGL